MIRRIDHVSLAVPDRQAALALFCDVLGARLVMGEDAPGFHWSVLEMGDSCLFEIIDPLGDESFLWPFLRARGAGAHHVTFHVEDLDALVEKLDAAGVPTFGLGEPYPGWKEVFIHPKHSFGLLLQFAEFQPLDWIDLGDQVPPIYARLQEREREAALSPILRLGDPRLRRACSPVSVPVDDVVRAEAERLQIVLRRLTSTVGFGRGLAAPQIGLEGRMIALETGDEPQILLDPQIVERSDETFTMWDDCYSFPNLLVKVARHSALSLTFRTLDDGAERWDVEDRGLAELLQHEIDHLDGVLAVDRAVEPGALVDRQVFESMREELEDQVDGVSTTDARSSPTSAR